jgi:hypothetical protein
VGMPVLLILLLYTVPVITSVDSVDYAMGTSQGTGVRTLTLTLALTHTPTLTLTLALTLTLTLTSQGTGAYVVSNFSLAAGWDSQPTFGSLPNPLRPSDMANLISHA